MGFISEYRTSLENPSTPLSYPVEWLLRMTHYNCTPDPDGTTTAFTNASEHFSDRLNRAQRADSHGSVDYSYSGAVVTFLSRLDQPT